MLSKKELINNLKEDATIEQLEEVGKINIDFIDEDLGLLIEVLEEEFNIKTEIQSLVGGQYLVYNGKNNKERCKMTKKEILQAIEKVTNGERFISYEQLEEIELVPYVYTENCGISGTGKGTLYTLYLMDANGNKTEEELVELVAVL